MGWLQGWLHIRLHSWQGFRAELHRGLCWSRHGQGAAPICRGHPILLQQVPCLVSSFELAHCLAQHEHETSYEQHPHLVCLVRGWAAQVICGPLLMDALRV